MVRFLAAALTTALGLKIAADMGGYYLVFGAVLAFGYWTRWAR